VNKLNSRDGRRLVPGDRFNLKNRAGCILESQTVQGFGKGGVVTDCVNLKKNAVACNCTYAGCPRHGICCECVAYHKDAGELPACYFDKADERTYDRSFENYMKRKV